MLLCFIIINCSCVALFFNPFESGQSKRANANRIVFRVCFAKDGLKLLIHYSLFIIRTLIMKLNGKFLFIFITANLVIDGGLVLNTLIFSARLIDSSAGSILSYRFIYCTIAVGTHAALMHRNTKLLLPSNGD